MVGLPRDGRLCLAVDLRRDPVSDGLSYSWAPLTTTVTYDLSQGIPAPDLGSVTTYTYELPDRPPPPEPEQPPDEPHVAD